MGSFALRPGGVTANLSEVSYRPDEGFQEGNSWHVAEATISADADTKLRNGPAAVLHDGMEFPVTVAVLEFETLPGKDEESEEDGAACTIEISYAEGLPKLALALGPLDHLTPKHQRSIFG